jgi:DNA-binding GntR family transcriptional regulator
LVVTPLEPDRIAKIYQLRGALDELAARLAAEVRFSMDPALLANGREACQRNDMKALIDADIAFHKAIYDASGNELIAQSALLHWVHLRRVMGAALQDAVQRDLSWHEHQAIATAIAEGNSERAVFLAHAHVNRGRDVVVSRMNEALQNAADIRSKAV